jgi:hypothetical protein
LIAGELRGGEAQEKKRDENTSEQKAMRFAKWLFRESSLRRLLAV